MSTNVGKMFDFEAKFNNVNYNYNVYDSLIIKSLSV